MLLRHLNSNAELFFRPGDDAASLRDTIAALDEIPETKRETIFDVAMGAYL